jgi:hypothetical protein
MYLPGLLRRLSRGPSDSDYRHSAEESRDAVDNQTNNCELPQFRFSQGVFLSALSAEYFRRLDVDGSKTLSLNEFPFVTSFKPRDGT